MLIATFNGTSSLSGDFRGLGMLGDAATITRIQQALQSLGQPITVNGNVDGDTLAALYTVMLSKLSQLNLPGPVSAAFSAVKGVDSLLSSITGGHVTVTDVLRYAGQLMPAIAIAPGGAQVQNAYNSFAKAVNDNAGAIATGLAALIIATTQLPAPGAGGASPPVVRQMIPISQILTTLPGMTATTKYAGCLSRFNTSRSVYSIYCPQAQVTAGLGSMVSNHLGELGATVSPPPPPGYVKTAEEVVQPAGVTPAGTEEDVPFYKKWWFWTAAVGGAAVIGGGSYFLFRRKKH
jgi:LPXTG-motif cell wall-anchored protein